MRFVTIGLLILYLSSLVIVPPGKLYLTVGLGFLLGLINVPILPASYPYAIKVTHGMSPAVVNGLMMSGSQVYSFLMSLLLDILFKKDQLYGLGFMSFTLVIGSLCTICIKDKDQKGKTGEIDASGDAENSESTSCSPLIAEGVKSPLHLNYSKEASE